MLKKRGLLGSHDMHSKGATDQHAMVLNAMLSFLHQLGSWPEEARRWVPHER